MITAEGRADLQKQLDRISEARSNENIVTWTVFSVFVAAMGLFGDAALHAASESAYVKGAIVALAALGLSIVWVIAMRRSLLHLELQEMVTIRLEQLLSIDPEYSLTYMNPFFAERMGSVPRAKPALRAVPLTSLVVWFVVALSFLVASVPRSLR
jgi:hypothetical protein